MVARVPGRPDAAPDPRALAHGAHEERGGEGATRGGAPGAHGDGPAPAARGDPQARAAGGAPAPDAAEPARSGTARAHARVARGQRSCPALDTLDLVSMRGQARPRCTAAETRNAGPS